MVNFIKNDNTNKYLIDVMKTILLISEYVFHT